MQQVRHARLQPGQAVRRALALRKACAHPAQAVALALGSEGQHNGGRRRAPTLIADTRTACACRKLFCFRKKYRPNLSKADTPKPSQRTCSLATAARRRRRPRLGEMHVQVQGQRVAGAQAQRCHQHRLSSGGLGPLLPGGRVYKVPGHQVQESLCGQGQGSGILRRARANRVLAID